MTRLRNMKKSSKSTTLFLTVLHKDIMYKIIFICYIFVEKSMNMYARTIQQYFVEQEQIDQYGFAAYDLVKRLVKTGSIDSTKNACFVLLDEEAVEKYNLEITESARRKLYGVLEISYRNEKILNSLELANNHVFLYSELEDLRNEELMNFIDNTDRKTYIFTRNWLRDQF